jgi:hypothetical protein
VANFFESVGPLSQTSARVDLTKRLRAIVFVLRFDARLRRTT